VFTYFSLLFIYRPGRAVFCDEKPTKLIKIGVFFSTFSPILFMHTVLLRKQFKQNENRLPYQQTHTKIDSLGNQFLLVRKSAILGFAPQFSLVCQSANTVANHANF